MKVGAVVVAAVAASLIASPMPVFGQGLKELLVGSRTGPTGSYKKNNIIRVKTTSSRNESVGVAANRAVTELAEMTKAKGFPRFAITKQVCGTHTMSNIPLYHTCNVTAQMLGADEQVAKVGKTVPTYLSVDAVLESARL